jgi:hypothetical protein
MTDKCENNMIFIFKKIAMLELKIAALAEAMGLEMQTKGEDGADGKAKS